MSDTFQSYVFNFGDDGQAAEACGILAARLIGDGYLSGKRAANVLGSEEGYEPGQRSAEFLVEDSPYWRSLVTNGVETLAGRLVEAGTSPEWVACPNCRRAYGTDSAQFAEAFEAVEEWVGGEDVSVRCPECGVAASIDLWDFHGALALGDCKLCFWNWPVHHTQVLHMLAEIVGLSPVKIDGRI